MARRVLVALALALSVVVPLGQPAQAAEPQPSRMAALGDSITRGYNACGWYVDCPSRSWSTGTTTSVNSHYLRLSATAPLAAYNDSRTGAKMSGLSTQVSAALTQQPDYVTILIGANDACTSTEAGMTPVSTFGAQFEDAMARLAAGLPDTRVYVASIPNIKRLWYIGKDSWAARTAWSTYGICQSMLARPRSYDQADVDRRARVKQRVVDYNSALAGVCATYVTCRFDGNAVFGYDFSLSQVSGWDYFHPNTAGQAALASVTWRTSFWP